MSAASLDRLCINTLRTLAIDQVQRANSGHPGTPMGAAPTAYCLWQRFLRFDPEDAAWPDRDRFVLSVGHASALLYGLLHLCGVKAATMCWPMPPTGGPRCCCWPAAAKWPCASPPTRS
ncbi:hypothetical protein CCR95_19625 [Thiocystis minor]|uniref:hypothetical protein n=1 Tax=Thiocystis minor TaxID=61597 RepID=UPI001913BE7C|nr:hypothetical protein [Thiocystis minor]